jgi:hypothetical protein
MARSRAKKGPTVGAPNTRRVTRNAALVVVIGSIRQGNVRPGRE